MTEAEVLAEAEVEPAEASLAALQSGSECLRDFHCHDLRTTIARRTARQYNCTENCSDNDKYTDKKITVSTTNIKTKTPATKT